MSPRLKLILKIAALAFATGLGVAFYWHNSQAAPVKSFNPNVISKNPNSVPLMQACTFYNSHCGREFKKTLDLYDWKVCRQVSKEQKGLMCILWWTPEELGTVFQALPGFNP